MTNPLWINADGGQPEYTAQSLRLSMSGLLTKGVPDRLGARPGVIPNGRDAVSLSGVQVTVHDCNVVLNPALSAQDGPYIAHFTEHTHTLDPGDGSNARIDIVVARVYDDDHDGSGQREAVTELITGNPSPSPARPAVPAGALLLRVIDVPADGTGSPSLQDYAPPSTVATGGVLPVRTADDLPMTGLPEGTYADLDGVGLLRWDGTDWQPGQDRMRLSDVALTGTVGTGTNCEIPAILRGKFRSYVLQVDAWTGDYLKALVIRVNGDESENYRAQAQAVYPDGTVAHSNDGESAFPRHSYLGQFGGFTQITFRPRGLGNTALIAWTTEGWANNGVTGSTFVRGGGRWSGASQELTHFTVRTSSSSDTWASQSRATLWGLR